MASENAAKAALRTSQNSVLGKGKRARGVTVTRSNQEELMRSVRQSPILTCTVQLLICSHSYSRLGKARLTVQDRRSLGWTTSVSLQLCNTALYPMQS